MSTRGLLAGTFLAATLITSAIAAPAAIAAPRPSDPGAVAPAAAAPVPVTSITCDGDTYKCTAKLQFGDGKWVATWGVSVSHP
jgi:poly(3-hydroxybutyrate) depolymerase